MKQVLVDSNVLVSFLTDRDERQQRLAADLFREAATGGLTLVLHQAALSEMVFVLLNLYRVAPAEAARTLADLVAMPGVVTVHDLAWSRLLELWPRQIPAFGDAFLATAASQGRCDAVATFDVKLKRHLKRLGLAYRFETTLGTT